MLGELEYCASAARRRGHQRAASVRRPPGPAPHVVRRRVARPRLPRGRARLGARRRRGDRAAAAHRAPCTAADAHDAGVTPSRRSPSDGACERDGLAGRALEPAILHGTVDASASAAARARVHATPRSRCALPLSRLDELPAPGIARIGRRWSAFRSIRRSRRRRRRAARAMDPSPARSANGVSADGEIVLYAFPRMLGLRVQAGQLLGRATIATARFAPIVAEVNNTFGERHHYVLRASGRARRSRDGETLVAHKALHVSPFCDVARRATASGSISAPGAGSRASITMTTTARSRCSRPGSQGRATPLDRAARAQPRVALRLVHARRGRAHPLQAARLWMKRVPCVPQAAAPRARNGRHRDDAPSIALITRSTAR